MTTQAQLQRPNKFESPMIARLLARNYHNPPINVMGLGTGTRFQEVINVLEADEKVGDVVFDSDG